MTKRKDAFIVHAAPVPNIIETESFRKVVDVSRDSKALWHYLELQMQSGVIGWHDAKSCFMDSVAKRIDELVRAKALIYPNDESGYEHKLLTRYYPRICDLAPANLQDLYRDLDKEMETIIKSQTMGSIEYGARRKGLLFLLQWTRELLLF